MGLNIYKKKVIFSKNSQYMNGGVYFVSKKLLNNQEYHAAKSIENDVLPDLIKTKKVGGFITNNFFLDIGTTANLNLAKKKLPQMLKKPAIFLDRDGVVNYDNGYTYKWKKFKFKKYVEKGLAYLQDKNYLIFIVTNQAGIAKGHFKEDDFHILHKKIKSYLSKKKLYFNDVKYCPYHPDAIIKKYKKNTQYRKPGNLMLKEIIGEWDIDIKKSIMIGDKSTDELAARKSKIYFEYDLNNFYKQIRSFVKKN